MQTVLKYGSAQEALSVLSHPYAGNTAGALQFLQNGKAQNWPDLASVFGKFDSADAARTCLEAYSSNGITNLLAQEAIPDGAALHALYLEGFTTEAAVMAHLADG
ncbi:MAG: hypothetical protein AAF570_08950 [Bacteroidota bacterium]